MTRLSPILRHVMFSSVYRILNDTIIQTFRKLMDYSSVIYRNFIVRNVLFQIDRTFRINPILCVILWSMQPHIFVQNFRPIWNIKNNYNTFQFWVEFQNHLYVRIDSNVHHKNHMLFFRHGPNFLEDCVSVHNLDFYSHSHIPFNGSVLPEYFLDTLIGFYSFNSL